MSNLKLPEKVTDKILDIADEHAGKIIDNIADKPTEALGTNIAAAINLVFSPIRYLGKKADIRHMHKLSIYEKELAEKEKSIPEDKRIEPDFQVISTTLENSKFCITNDDLRRMFVNLIGSAINSDTADMVHPAFAEMIKQMSSIDAQILKSFSVNDIQPIMEINQLFKPLNFYSTAYTNLFLIEKDSVQSLDKASVAITNLNRIGLINIDYTKTLFGEPIYEDLVKVADNMTHNFGASNFKYVKGIASLTPMGRKFIKICLSD
ncbi:MAG: DUF4393 domain-containing protein [Oscillospiraceae bacterium]|nr:DUF4393 domain-containing protein [Oscillospiraceae bacterium]